MTTNSEFPSLHRQLLADLRDGSEPPTADEMLAYLRGETSQDEELRLQQRLVAYPELARTLTVPFPEAAEPGDPDYLTDAEYDEHWKSLQERMHPRAVPIRRAESPRLWRQVSFALAASLICVFGALLWQFRSNIELRNDLGPRMPADAQMLYPEGRRGPSAGLDTITAEGDATLVLPLITAMPHASYRIQLENAEERRLWDSGAVQPRVDPSSGDETFTVVVPRSFLDPGDYAFLLYDGESAEQQLMRYPFRVPTHR